MKLASGPVLFCDVLLLAQRDLVVVIPKCDNIPDRGERVRCTLFLENDDDYSTHRDGIVHWEMAYEGQRLAAIFLDDPAPDELLKLTDTDRRAAVRFPASVPCEIQAGDDIQEGRMVSYSLSGVATQSETPLVIGNRYELRLQAGNDTIRLEATCRWGVETSYGYVNGYSIADDACRVFAHRAFRGSVMAWNLNRPRNADDELQAAEEPGEAAGQASAISDAVRPAISRSTILLLSAILIGLSIRVPEESAELIFLAGCTGVITYISLGWVYLSRKRARAEAARQARRAAHESRLGAHLR